jgi:hypothetical protein
MHGNDNRLIFSIAFIFMSEGRRFQRGMAVGRTAFDASASPVEAAVDCT